MASGEWAAEGELGKVHPPRVFPNGRNHSFPEHEPGIQLGPKALVAQNLGFTGSHVNQLGHQLAVTASLPPGPPIPARHKGTSIGLGIFP